MNIDDHPAIAGQLGIQSIPAVIAFVNGQPVDGFMGAVPESKVKEFIAKVGGPSDAETAIAEAIAAANELVEAGDFVQASEIFSSILHAVPDNVDAVVGLATCLLESGDDAERRGKFWPRFRQTSRTRLPSGRWKRALHWPTRSSSSVIRLNSKSEFRLIPMIIRPGSILRRCVTRRGGVKMRPMSCFSS